MTFAQKDLISTKDLSEESIKYILDSADSFVELNKREIKKTPTLKGKTIVNLFFENSTRTRTSFEIAAKRLSADAVNFTGSSSSTQKGETLIDTVQNINAMKADVMVVRHAYSGAVKFIAENCDASIINAGDGTNEHPTQALLDLYTIRKKRGELRGTTVTILGDIMHSRVARSNIWAMKTLGMNIKLFGPPTVMPYERHAYGCQICRSMEEAIEGADVLMTLRVQRERQSNLLIPSIREYANFFGLMSRHLEMAKSDVLILHPGPINRGVEISSYVADSAQSAILEQVEYGVAIRMALLCIVRKKQIGMV